MISTPMITAEQALASLDEAVVLDARAGSDAREAYREMAVAGAFRADLETDLSEIGDPSVGGRHPLPRLERWLERVTAWGIAPSTPILIYDAMNGGMAAARAWWMFNAIGHERVAVVDGGFAALREAGVPTGPGRADRTNTPTQYSTAVWRWPVVDADFVDRVRAEADWKVVDARAPERYAGESEPIDPVAGHIRGARNFYWKTQVDGAGKLIGRPLLRERYAELLGEVPPERVVCYCGSGVTACHLLLAMAACGLPGGQLYVGSWSEWCRTREGAI